MVQYDVIQAREIIVGAKPGTGHAAAPSLRFGDGDTGFYESLDDTLNISLGGSTKFLFSSNIFKGNAATAAALLNEGATSTNPTLVPNKADDDTGIGWTTTDALSLIAGGRQGIKLTEASSFILQKLDVNVGMTADVGSAQGSGPILSSYNVYDTVGTAGDAATLPATFDTGTIVYIKNGAAANSMDIFPASGDDLGEGGDTVLALAAKDFVVFIATTGSSTWEQLMTGTCVS